MENLLSSLILGSSVILFSFLDPTLPFPRPDCYRGLQPTLKPKLAASRAVTPLAGRYGLRKGCLGSVYASY